MARNLGDMVQRRRRVEKVRIGMVGIDGIRGVELANAMLLSSWQDDWVEIPVDRDVYFEELQKRSKMRSGGHP